MAHGSDLPRVVADPDHGAQADERAAFTALYRSNFDYVWTQLRRLGVEECSLEDAAQEVFLVVSRQLGDFAGRASIRTWLFAIARRIAFRFRRTAARTMRRHLALAQRQVEPVPSSLDAALQHHEAERLLAVFLRQLDDDKRAAFILGEIEGLGRVVTRTGPAVQPQHRLCAPAGGPAAVRPLLRLASRARGVAGLCA